MSKSSRFSHSAQVCPKRALGVLSRLTHRETHVVQNQSGKIIEISGPLAVIWTLIDGRRSVPEIAMAASVGLADVSAGIESLRFMGMIR